ncbi:MAG: ATP synthase F1 subunit epsilon [Candidatus Pacebacteria bacterium RIFCSPHIGHO2_01_FULL_46_10]|nr:MAG: ATP synthase F1 subunit epsilon [Candidatus Pacebacteria bacterium RIFCSPHIGHO2_01_FULL_46_10]
MSHHLTLTIVTQEKELLKQDIEQITAPTTSGEITVLPNHIPLFTQLQEGILRFKVDGKDTYVVITGGFMDVGPNNTITVLANSASFERDATLARAQEAREKAKEAMQEKIDTQAFVIAEAPLQRVLMEMKAYTAGLRKKRPTLPNV